MIKDERWLTWDIPFSHQVKPGDNDELEVGLRWRYATSSKGGGHSNVG